ncbi:MAG: hypothetical protein Q8K97_11590 [Pseudohongiella sp.]|nr:hypothetical protein [Pseudohongiella sp.]
MANQIVTTRWVGRTLTVLIAVGLATLFIPPIPGITLVLLGALFWAQASERAARMGDKVELGIRKGWRRLRS